MKLFSLLKRVPYLSLLAVPLLMIFAGAASNQAVLVANWGKFPVMVNKRQVELMQDGFDQPRDYSFGLDSSIHFVAVRSTQRAYPVKGTQYLDNIHSVMGHNSNLKFLADWINLQTAIYSPGDLLLELGAFLLAFTPLMWCGLAARILMSHQGE